jgi:hypothetical protein
MPRWLLWVLILVPIPVALLCCVGGVGIYFAFNWSGAGAAPSFTAAKIDPNNLGNTRAWSANTVKRLKEVEAKGNDAATKAEIKKVEQSLKDGLLNKKVHWAFSVNGMQHDAEVDVEQFFGTDDGRAPPPAGPQFNGKPFRKLYFRVFFGKEGDGIMVDTDVSRAQAKLLRKGSMQAIDRRVIEVRIDHNDKWVGTNPWDDRIDVLDTFCITIVVAR